MAGTAATYVDNDTFTVSGTDNTEDFNPGRRVKADCGGDGDKYGWVDTSSFGDPLTTVNLTSGSDAITSNLTEVYIAQTDVEHDSRFYNSAEVDTISGSLNDKLHTQGTDTTLGTMTADIDMDDTYQIVNLQAPAAAGEALRQTTNITESDLEQLTDGSDTTLHDHDGISENTNARHTRSHTMTSTSDHTSGNWKLFASNGSGEITEIVHGTDTYVLTSNGAAVAPTWQEASGGDPITGATEHAVVRAASATTLEDSGITISDNDEMVLPATSSLTCPERLIIPLNEPTTLANGCIWIA